MNHKETSTGVWIERVFALVLAVAPWNSEVPVMPWGVLCGAVLAAILIREYIKSKYVEPDAYSKFLGSLCIFWFVATALCLPMYMKWRKDMAAATEGYIHSRSVGHGSLGESSPIAWDSPGQALSLYPDSSLAIDRGRDGIEFSAVVQDRNGNVVVSVDHNHWRVTNSCLDKNYSEDSLEVKDLRGHVVLQIVLLPDAVKLRGEFHNGDGKGALFADAIEGKGKGGNVEIWGSDAEESEIQRQRPFVAPMFLYPSRDHWGESVSGVSHSQHVGNKPLTLGTGFEQRAALSIFPRQNNLAIQSPFKVGDNLSVYYEYYNSGTGEAKNYKRFVHAFLVYGDVHSPTTIDSVWNKFVSWRASLEPNQPVEQSIHIGPPGLISSTQGPYEKITKRQLKDITLGTAHIFLTASISYEDKTGSFVQEGCFWAQEPAIPTSLWAPCRQHGARIP
jgi:hypothetical protein